MTSTTRTAPKWARKRIILPALAFATFVGVQIGGTHKPLDDAKPAAAHPAATTTVTASPSPAPTVTETETVEVEVTETVTEQPATAGNGGSSDAVTADRNLTGGSAYYKNCDAARAAGAAPVHRGDPGYGRHLDRDGDGVGCE